MAAYDCNIEKTSLIYALYLKKKKQSEDTQTFSAYAQQKCYSLD